MTDEMRDGSRAPAGAQLWIETARLENEELGIDRPQLTSGARRRTVSEISDEMVNGVGDAVKRVCAMIAGAFEAANRPDELTVTFGLKVAAKGNTNVFVVTTEASGEATLSVEAKWTNSKVTTAVTQTAEEASA